MDPKQRRFFKTNYLYELFSLNDVDENGVVETTDLFAGTGSEVYVDKIYICPCIFLKQSKKHFVLIGQFEKNDACSA